MRVHLSKAVNTSIFCVRITQRSVPVDGLPLSVELIMGLMTNRINRKENE